VFLERSGARAINSDSLNRPNPSCPVCSPVLARVEIDLEIATLGHLVEDILQGQLGYGENTSVTTDSGLVIYEIDFDDNLNKKLTHFGIKGNSFITVRDDNDPEANEPDPRVDLNVMIIERWVLFFERF
jgi:ubiquitin-like 1-activating enzyme E1 B